MSRLNLGFKNCGSYCCRKALLYQKKFFIQRRFWSSYFLYVQAVRLQNACKAFIMNLN